MKLNIAYPRQGTQKQFDIEDELTLRPFYDKRIAQEVTGDSLGENWRGYVFRITGGSDKDGFPMRQGVMTTKKVHLLLKGGDKGYRCKREGVRKRKYVRGCIVDANLSVLSMVVVKKGEHEIEGLTDVTVPRRLGPKRAGKIIKMFNLQKEDDVRRFVLRRPTTYKNKEKQEAADAAGKKKHRAPKIQRLITPIHLQRRRRIAAAKSTRSLKNKTERDEFNQLLKKIKVDNMAELRKKQAQPAPAVTVKATATKGTGKATATKAIGKVTATKATTKAPVKATTKATSTKATATKATPKVTAKATDVKTKSKK